MPTPSQFALWLRSLSIPANITKCEEEAFEWVVNCAHMADSNNESGRSLISVLDYLCSHVGQDNIVDKHFEGHDVEKVIELFDCVEDIHFESNLSFEEESLSDIQQDIEDLEEDILRMESRLEVLDSQRDQLAKRLVDSSNQRAKVQERVNCTEILQERHRQKSMQIGSDIEKSLHILTHSAAGVLQYNQQGQVNIMESKLIV